MKKNQFKKVIVAMSGGVDSAVCAYLLLQQGYQVEGMFMKNWEEDDTFNYCASEQDLKDAKGVAKKIGIYLHEVNFSTEYWNDVFKNFLLEHQKGNTPNPDILCNKKIKFGIFFDFAINNLQADYIATGHYVQIQSFNNQNMLIRGKDPNKDQSYFLYTLKHEKLKKILFPIGKFYKTEIRNIAKKIHLPNANKPDSMGICFIGASNMKQFLNRFIKQKKGNIVDEYGCIVGTHTGLMNYTIGQRKGLGIGGNKHKKNIPWYVLKKNLINNSLTVVQGINHHQLLSSGLIAHHVSWINKVNISSNFFCTAKTRYRQNDIPCQVQLITLTTIQIIFQIPVFCITPGQSVVLYSYHICLGGGIIHKIIPKLYV